MAVVQENTSVYLLDKDGNFNPYSTKTEYLRFPFEIGKFVGHQDDSGKIIILIANSEIDHTTIAKKFFGDSLDPKKLVGFGMFIYDNRPGSTPLITSWSSMGYGRRTSPEKRRQLLSILNMEEARCAGD